MSDSLMTIEDLPGSDTVGRGSSVLELPKVSVLTATAIAVADMVGTGVFTSLGFQVRDIPSPFSLMMLWVVGGLVALGGALSYAELAAAFPRSGGEYNFLSRAFRPAIGFMAGWVSATVGFAAPVALAAMAFGQYFDGVFPGAPALALGVGIIWLVSLVHLFGVKSGSALQNISTLVKLGLICVLIVAGLVSADTQSISFSPSTADIGYITGAPFAISLVFVLYSYSGWNAATYIAGEVKNPQRNLPRSILAAVTIVTLLYVALNAVFLYTTPMNELAGQLDVGLIAGAHFWRGRRAHRCRLDLRRAHLLDQRYDVGRPACHLGDGEDNTLLRVFSKTAKNGVPVNALLFQLIVATTLLLTQSFEAVLDFIQFSLTLCSFLTVLGVIVLRFRQPHLPRPYRAWGYPATPLLFLAVTGFVLLHLLAERPFQSLASLSTMMAGLLIYAVSRRLQKGTSIYD